MDDDDTLASTQNRRPPGNTRLPPLGRYRTMVYVCSYKAVKYKFKISQIKQKFVFDLELYDNIIVVRFDNGTCILVVYWTFQMLVILWIYSN